MKKLLLSFVVIIIGLASSASMAGKDHPYTIIDAATLQQMQADDAKLLVIDSRSGKYLNDGTVIKGAINLSTTDTDSAHLAKLAASKDTSIVFYCNNVNCPASELSAYKANAAGYTNIYKYPGGIDEWVARGLPTEKL